MEIFKPVPGFEGLYDVSNSGCIKSLQRLSKHSISKHLTIKERILKQGVGTNGYNYVVIRKEGKSITLYTHRIVACVFLENAKSLPQVNHIDGNKNNNNSSNLEWCSQSENMIHAYKNNLQSDRKGVNNPNYKHGLFVLS